MSNINFFVDSLSLTTTRARINPVGVGVYALRGEVNVVSAKLVDAGLRRLEVRSGRIRHHRVRSDKVESCDGLSALNL